MTDNEDAHVALLAQSLPLIPPPSTSQHGPELQLCLDTIAHRVDHAFAMLPAADALETRKRFICGLHYEMVSMVFKC